MSFLKKLKRQGSSAKEGLQSKVGELENAKASLEQQVEQYKGEIEGYKQEAEGAKKKVEEVKVEAEEKVNTAKKEVETVKKEAEETKTGLMAELAKTKKIAEDALAQVSKLKGQLAEFTSKGIGEGISGLKDSAGGALSGGMAKLGL